MSSLKSPIFTKVIFWLTLAATALAGYFLTKYPYYWKVSLLKEGVVWIVACGLIAWGLQRWQPRWGPVLFCGLLFIYLLGGVGLAASLSMVFFLVSAHAAGHLGLRLLTGHRRLRFGGTESLVVGLILFVALFGGLIHFPINERWLYMVLLALPLVWVLYRDAASLGCTYTDGLRHFQAWAQGVPLPALVACVSLIAWVARFAFFPTIGYDDNAHHLRMWTELLYQQKYSFDVVTQIWAAAPFAVNLLHAIISLVAGEDARSALNLALMLLLLWQVAATLAMLSLTALDRLLLLLLLASTPMLGNLLLSLQTELFLAFLCAAGTRLVLTCDEGWIGRNMVGVLAIAALCTATKLPGAALGAFLVFAMVLKIRFLERSAMAPQMVGINLWRLLILLGIMCFAAFHSYWYAYLITGNPVLPLYNGIFKSSFLAAENYDGGPWAKGFNPITYWNIFFQTSDFFESRNFVAGFQYLFLFPLALLAMWRKPVPRNLLLVLLPLLGFGLVIFLATQYWRYLFPVMPLASILIAALFIPSGGVFVPLARGLAVACVALNFFFFPGVFWMFTIPLQALYTEAGRNKLTQSTGVKAITARLNHEAAGARVLYPQNIPSGATLNGIPLYTNWYSPKRAGRFSTIKTLEDVASFIHDEKVQFAILSLADQSRPGEPTWQLREYMSRWGYPQYQEGAYILYRLLDRKLAYREVFNLQQSPVNGQILAVDTPRALPEVPTLQASTARYSISFKCSAPKGVIVAQLSWNSWNIGPSYYRLIPCVNGNVSFSESVPVPVGVSRAQVYVSVKDVESAWVNGLTVEVH